MVYVWEFEFFDSGGMVDAVPCGSLGGGGTFGSDLNDAVASAADFLAAWSTTTSWAGSTFPRPTSAMSRRTGARLSPSQSAASLVTFPPSPQPMPPVCSASALRGCRS